MNKRVGILLLAVAIAAAAGIYAVHFFKQEDAGAYAAYLPQDTLATVSLTHLAEISASFADSPLGRLLAKATMNEILAELQASPEAITSYNETYDSVVTLVNNPAFLAVFGDDAALALLSPDLARLRATPREEVERSMVVFATTTVSGALETFAKAVMRQAVTTEVVDGVELTRVQLDSGKTYYGATVNGLVLLSAVPATVTACLQAATTEQTLETTAAFQQTGRFWEENEAATVYSRLFVNPLSLQALLAQGGEEAASLAGYLEGITYFASLTYHQGEELRSDTRAGFTAESLHPALRAAMDEQSGRNTSLNLFGNKTLIYDWSSSLSAELLLHSLAAGDRKQVDRYDAAISEYLDLSLAELLAAFGPQYGFTVNEIVNSGFFPVPKVVAFVEVRDHQRAVEVFERLRAAINKSGFAREQQVEAGGQTVFYWSLLPGEATQPALVLTPTMLYAANGKSVLVDLLNRSAAADALPGEVAADMGVRLPGQLEAAGMGAMVVYPARLGRELEDIAGWLITTLSAVQGISASRLGEEILALLQAYEVVGMTSRFTPTHAEWNSTLIPREPIAGSE